MRTALWYPETRKFAPLVKDLGVDGMSSDEEEYVGGVLQHYRVSSLPWRYKLVTVLLRLLDALYRRYRSKIGQGSLHGARPHLRYLTDVISSNTRGVPGLPRNAYDPEWLDGLRPLQRQDLQVQDTVVDFAVDRSVKL